MAELTYGAHDFMAGALDELRELVERRRRGLHPVEVSGLVSTAALALRSTPEDNTRHEELIELPDGGTVRLVWQRAGRESYRSELGIVLILPGLNNSSHWPAIQQTARCFCQRGFDTAVLDYRGVGGLELTSAKVGCCDAWRDLPTVLSAVVRGAHPRAPVLAVGFSMGGTILLNHLSAEAATTPIRAAATVSSPLLIAQHMQRLETGLDGRLVNLGMVWMKKLELAQSALARRVRGAGSATVSHLAGVDWRELASTATLRGLERAVICKLHGYADPEDYYRASTPDFDAIRVPWLCLHARDDPVINIEPIQEVAARVSGRNPRALFVLTARGGHLGYAGGGATTWPFVPSWADEMAAGFLLHCRRHHPSCVVGEARLAGAAAAATAPPPATAARASEAERGALAGKVAALEEALAAAQERLREQSAAHRRALHSLNGGEPHARL